MHKQRINFMNHNNINTFIKNFRIIVIPIFQIYTQKIIIILIQGIFYTQYLLLLKDFNKKQYLLIRFS